MKIGAQELGDEVAGWALVDCNADFLGQRYEHVLKRGDENVAETNDLCNSVR